MLQHLVSVHFTLVNLMTYCLHDKFLPLICSCFLLFLGGHDGATVLTNAKITIRIELCVYRYQIRLLCKLFLGDDLFSKHQVYNLAELGLCHTFVALHVYCLC